jgi:pilus assembly protein CpaB
MRLGRLLLLVALVIVVGGGALYFLTQQGGSGGLTDAQIAQTQAALETVPVVFLQQPVARGEAIPIEKLGIKTLPKIQVPDIYFSDPNAVAGKLARLDLEQGVFLTEAMLMEGLSVASDAGSEHARLIPEGMVAFPVPVNRFSSVGFGLARGDRVDVIVTQAFVDLDTQFQSETPNQTAGILAPGSNLVSGGGANVLTAEAYSNLVAQSVGGGDTSIQGRAELDALLDQPFYYVPSEPQRPRVVSQMIMQNLVVLNVGTFPVYNQKGEQVDLATPTPEGAAQPEGEEPVAPSRPVSVPPDIITLVMWPQDAVTLNYLLYTGAKVTLALRAAGDGSQTPTDAVTLQYLMDVYRIPLPVRLPYGTEPRIDQLVTPRLENDPADQVIIE